MSSRIHPRRSASVQLRRAVQLEALESRDLLSCVLGGGATYDAASGNLSIQGTNGGDNIAVAVVNTDPDATPGTGDETSNLIVTRNGTDVANCSLLDLAAPINKLAISGGNGNDTITVADEVLVGVQADGGNGQDLIDGGGGNDSLSGGNGKDSLDGAAGNDLLDGGNGVDFLQGGAGVDSLRGGNAPDSLNDTDQAVGDVNLDGGHGMDTINGQLEPPAHHGHGHGHS